MHAIMVILLTYTINLNCVSSKLVTKATYVRGYERDMAEVPSPACIEILQPRAIAIYVASYIYGYSQVLIFALQ